ncbi:MAG: VWA domain-containing protein [Planctomycetes bacterium]|nr:VWA domain-containing protein [Planctomycetota bacterium]
MRSTRERVGGNRTALLPPLLSFLLVAAFAAPAPAQRPARGANPPEPEPEAKPLREDDVERIARAYDGADTWTLRAMVLLSLGKDFPPTGARLVLDAAQDKDERLPPYAIELLRGMDAEALKKVATPELVGELVERTLRTKHRLLRERTLDVLARIAPEAGATTREAWRAWWKDAQKTYAPPAWVPPPKPPMEEEFKTTATLFVERAFDLRDAGLDVAIVIDTTGSMQPAIDAARDAIGDVVTLLSNVAPKLRLGLVEYKDLGDLGDGAQVLVPLSRGEKAVHEKLGRLIASGGGDAPERVEKGVEFALGTEMNWNKEANRLILVIGDAPPHAESQAGLLELVKRAHDEPFARPPKPGKPEAPRTGGGPKPSSKAEPLRPFITSTIYTAPEAKKTFEEIAKAGGGASVYLDVGRGGRPARGGKDAPEPEDASGADPAVRSVVEHIMLLSFGAEHRAALSILVRTFFEYLDGAK